MEDGQVGITAGRVGQSRAREKQLGPGKGFWVVDLDSFCPLNWNPVMVWLKGPEMS